jgi:hypothetical protein
MREIRAVGLMALATVTSLFFFPWLVLMKVAEACYEGCVIWWSCCDSAWRCR